MSTAKPNYLELKKAFESLEYEEYKQDVREMFKDKQTRENFSIREAAYNLLGHEVYQHAKSLNRFDLKSIYEAAGEMGTDAFLDINSQFMYANVYDAYTNEEEFSFTRIIGERKATNTKGEKIPCYTDILNLPLPFRPERGTFDDLAFADDWIFTPPTLDRGGLLALTEELLFDDKVGDVANRDRALGYAIGVTREIDAINSYIDENAAQSGGTVVPYPTGAKPWQYNWKGTGGISTFNSNTGAHTFDNLVTGGGSALTDWTSLNLAQQKFYAMLNPYTNLPINILPRHLVVPKSLLPIAERITRATSVWHSTATTSTWDLTNSPTPVPVNYEIVSTRLLSQRMSNATASTSNWYLGDISKTVQCMMVFPLEILEAPPLNPDQLRRRIIKQWRVSTDYAYCVWQPRNSIKAQGT